MQYQVGETYTLSTENSHTFRVSPVYVGGWMMPGGTFYIACTKKPRWLTRFLMLHLMEWEWRE